MPTLPGKRKAESEFLPDAPIELDISDFNNVDELTEFLEEYPPGAPTLLAQEKQGKQRVTWLQVLEPAAKAAKAKAPEPKVVESGEVKGDKLPTMKDRMRHGVEGAPSVSERLMKNWKPEVVEFTKEDRVKNRALPNNFLAIENWPEEFGYKWVPCPPRHRDFLPAEAANLQAHERSGWRFYDIEDITDKPNDLGLPYKTGIEQDGSKVRYLDHWLMFKPRDYDERARRDALRKWNAKRETKKEPGRHTRETEGGTYEYVVHSETGEAVVGDLLRENPAKADDQDTAWLPE